MENNNKDDAVKFAEEIDFSRIDRNDRVYTRAIVLALLTFHDVMPKLDINIYKAPDHYNLTITNWNQRVNGPKLYNLLYNPQTRGRSMDYVTDYDLIPTDDDGKGKLLIQIARSGGVKTEKKIK